MKNSVEPKYSKYHSDLKFSNFVAIFDSAMYSDVKETIMKFQADSTDDFNIKINQFWRNSA